MNPTNEYQTFISTQEADVSPAISSLILHQVHRDLNPNPFLVFSKLLAIHFASALVTLSLCPQFGFRLLGDGMGLMHFFMGLGTYGCLVACGAFFTSVTLVLAGLILRGEEIRKIREHRWLELSALAMLSLGFFIMIDAELIFGLTAAWFVGAMAGSLGALEITWSLRFRKAHT